VSTSPAAGPLRYGSTVEVRVSKGPAPVTVPAIGGGSSWSSADSALQAVRLVPVETYAYSDTVPAGDVLGVTPAPGTTGVAVGTHVTVEVSRGPRLVAVPPVAGDSIATAIGALRAAGFVVTEQIGPPFATKATTTLPAPGAEERPGASVTLYVA
jgi:serine/threonine-protein kinase